MIGSAEAIGLRRLACADGLGKREHQARSNHPQRFGDAHVWARGEYSCGRRLAWPQRDPFFHAITQVRDVASVVGRHGQACVHAGMPAGQGAIGATLAKRRFPIAERVVQPLRRGG